jgi:MYXO-CTERM domain-containing protein
MFGLTKDSHRLLKALTVIAVLLVATPALADRVVWRKSAIDESSESWRVDVEIHLSKAPDIAHVPMQFKFEPTTYFERTLVDGAEGPQLRKVPLDNKQPLIESVDMGFLDPGSGKIQKRTRFSFRLTRARGFEAGEYKVTITNKRSNRKMQPASKSLTLNGENEVIDRRSMVFDTKKADEKAKQKREDDNKSAIEEFEQREDPNSEEFWAGGPTEAEGKGEDDIPPPAHMQENPGACGCRVPGEPAPPWAAGVFALGLGAAFVRRRRVSA